MRIDVHFVTVLHRSKPLPVRLYLYRERAFVLKTSWDSISGVFNDASDVVVVAVCEISGVLLPVRSLSGREVVPFAGGLPSEAFDILVHLGCAFAFPASWFGHLAGLDRRQPQDKRFGHCKCFQSRSLFPIGPSVLIF